MCYFISQLHSHSDLLWFSFDFLKSSRNQIHLNARMCESFYSCCHTGASLNMTNVWNWLEFRALVARLFWFVTQIQRVPMFTGGLGSQDRLLWVMNNWHTSCKSFKKHQWQLFVYPIGHNWMMLWTVSHYSDKLGLYQGDRLLGVNLFFSFFKKKKISYMILLSICVLDKWVIILNSEAVVMEQLHLMCMILTFTLKGR